MKFTPPLPLRATIPVTVPRGYHFHPTDEQLISYYLKLKVQGKPIPAIPDIAMEEVELYGPSQGKEPWELFWDPNVSFYVFSKLETTSRSSKTIKRVADRDTWDLQNTTNVFQSDGTNNTVIIGLKRMFRFEIKNEKVPRWIMHEYTLSSFPGYALCEIRHVLEGSGRKRSDSGSVWSGSSSVCVGGDEKRVRVITDSFGADINDFGGDSSFVPPTQILPLLLTNGGAEEPNHQSLLLPDWDDMINVDDLFMFLESDFNTDSSGADINANTGNGGDSNFVPPTYQGSVSIS